MAAPPRQKFLLDHKPFSAFNFSQEIGVGYNF
jgi:hypothetical protein